MCTCRGTRPRHGWPRPRTEHSDEPGAGAAECGGKGTVAPAVEHRAQESRVDVLDDADVVVVQHLQSAVFSDAQIRTAAAAHDTGVEAAETDGIAAQLAEALHDALVRLAGVCHEEMVHGHPVRVAAHIAAL